MEVEDIFSDYFQSHLILQMPKRKTTVKDAGNKKKLLQIQRKLYSDVQVPDENNKTIISIAKKQTNENVTKNKQVKRDINFRSDQETVFRSEKAGTHKDNTRSMGGTDKVGDKIAIYTKKLEDYQEIIKYQKAKENSHEIAKFNENIRSVGIPTEEADIEKCDQNSIKPKRKPYVGIANNELKNNRQSGNTFLKQIKETTPNLECDLQSLLIRLALTSTDQATQVENVEDKKSATQPEVNRAKLDLVTTSLKTDEMDFFKIKAINNYSKRDWYLMRKFAKKWKELTKNRIKDERQNALNAFFSKLENKKDGFTSQTDLLNRAKKNARDYSNYQHRYKMQKHIIALQKAKLEEQTRLIDELKYNKIVEASKNSVEDMREALRKTYFEIDRHLKPKIKCLTNELRVPEIEEQSLVLQCLKMPQFLQRMEKRAREREEKHALIRERRRQMEEDRVRIKQQAELAKAEMDKEERMRILKELKEKRKREKIENIRKKQLAERMRALQVMADLHYEKNLVSRCGLQPMKRLLEMKRDNFEKARSHYRFQLVKNVFLNWMFYTEDMWMERHYKAEDFYRKKILHQVFDAFKINHHELILKKQVADDYYDLYVVQLAFRKLRLGVEQLKCEQTIKWDKAVAYHNSNLTFKVFTCWRSLPALNALQREQEARKARWRQKVLQVVPDYQPPED